MVISAAILALLLGAFVFLILPRASLAGRTLSFGIFVVLIAVIYGRGMTSSAFPSHSGSRGAMRQMPRY